MWIWEFTTKSQRQFVKLDNQTKKRVIAKLDFWAKTGDPLAYSEPMIGSDLGSYRFRVGSYRIVFDAEEEKIIVLAVGHRKDIYR
jgi:mRNA interferase RelE/StbE